MVWRTVFITMSTSFLLGTTFTHWIADHNVLWKAPVTDQAIHDSITYYSLLSSSPSGMGWVYIAVVAVLLISIGGKTLKGYHGSGGEGLFDGGSLVLVASITYYQLAEVYPAITRIPNPLPDNLIDHDIYPTLLSSVRDLATNNIMTAVMLTGLILLQGGRYYAKRPSSPPPSAIDSSCSTPANASSPVIQPASERSGTPFRHMTDDEALDLAGSGDESSGEGKNRSS